MSGLRGTTKRGKAKQQCTLSEELLQIVFLQAGDGIFLVDEQSTIIEANPRGCEMLGFSRDEIVGLPLMNYVPADEIMPLAEKMGRLAAEKQVITESALLRKDGTRVEMEISARMLSNGQILGLARDITSRIQAEQAIRESAEKFRALVEHSQDGIIIVNEKGLIAEWNRGQEQISGLKRSDVLGKPSWEVEFTLLPENLRTKVFLEHLQKNTLEILASGHGHEVNQPRETTFQCPDGASRNVEIMMYTYQTSVGYCMGSIVRDITERKQAQMRMEYMAMHDWLTSLPNRQFFQDRLEQAIGRAARGQNSVLAVMMLDLDHFKEINDTYGHAYGDQLLKIVSKRLQSCLRKSDTVSRMGGDEFALINEETEDIEAIKQIAQKVLDVLSQPMEFEGQRFDVTASIGISLYSSDCKDAITLLRQADIAMYSAKRSRNCYKFYAPITGQDF